MMCLLIPTITLRPPFCFGHCYGVVVISVDCNVPACQCYIRLPSLLPITPEWPSHKGVVYISIKVNKPSQFGSDHILAHSNKLSLLWMVVICYYYLFSVWGWLQCDWESVLWGRGRDGRGGRGAEGEEPGGGRRRGEERETHDCEWRQWRKLAISFSSKACLFSSQIWHFGANNSFPINQ